MTSRLSSACLGLLLVALVGAAPGQAQIQTVSVGAQGELYTVVEGSYGDLFPDQGLSDDHRVLAIDVVHPNGSTERLLVPGTESAEIEDSASLVFENSSETLFVLWQTRVSFHSSLNLASYRAGEWSTVAELWGSPYGWKSSPQLAVTRDLFKTVEDDEVRTWTRTVVDILWGEDRAGGIHTFYSPVVLLNGAYLGSSPVYDLSELAADLGVKEEASVGLLSSSLADVARIQIGSNDQTVVVAFADSLSRKLVSLELEILPGEVAHLADRLGHQIIEIGRELDPPVLADRLGHQIIEIGHKIGLHPGLTAYAAASIEAEVENAPPDEPLESLAERLGHQIIEIGARMTGRGVDRTLERSGFLSVAPSSADLVATGEGPLHRIRASVVSSRSLPLLEEWAPPVRLFLSRSGVDVLLAWQTDRGLSFLESREAGWSPVFEIRVGEGGNTLERALEILRLRAESLHHVED